MSCQTNLLQKFEFIVWIFSKAPNVSVHPTSFMSLGGSQLDLFVPNVLADLFGGVQINEFSQFSSQVGGGALSSL